MKMSSLLKLTSLVGLAICGSHSFANSEKLTFEGVVSIGYLSPSDNSFVKKEPGEGAILSENSFRANYNFGGGLSATGQVVLRKGGDFVDDSLQLDFLQLEYRDDLFSMGEQSLKVGRFKINNGLYNQSRDISFTRPSILMPQSVYVDIIRNFLLSADGVSFNNYIPLENSDISFSLSLGESVLDDKFGTVTLAETATGDWESDTNFYSHLSWDSMNVSLGISHSDVDITYRADATAFLPINFMGTTFPIPLFDGNIEGKFTTLSAQYRLEKWEFTAETVKRSLDFRGFNAADAASSTEFNGYYLQAKYIFDQPFTATIRYDFTDVDLDFAPDAISEAKDLTIGLNWRISEQWLLAVEHHFIEGAAWVPPLNKVGDLQIEEDWSLSAIQLSYLF